jgi:hypothetical protein
MSIVQIGCSSKFYHCILICLYPELDHPVFQHTAEMPLDDPTAISFHSERKMDE